MAGDRTMTTDPKIITYRWAAICAVLLVAIAALAIGFLATQEAQSTRRAVNGSCQFFRDLSEVPITPTSTKALLTIIADARTAYAAGGCPSVKGNLPAPDPRVAPFLSRGTR